MTALLLAALLMGPLDDPSLRDPHVTAVAGGAVSFGTAFRTYIVPFASVAVNWTMAGEERPLSAYVEGTLAGLPDPELMHVKFRALEMPIGISYRPSATLAAEAFCEGGFATRLVRDGNESKTSAPMWGSCGVLFRDGGWSRANLRVGIGPDERLGYGWTMAVHVDGSIRLVDVGEYFGARVVARAILGLETPTGQSQRVNIIGAGIGISWDND